MNFPAWVPKWVSEEFQSDFRDEVTQEHDWTGGDEQSKEWIVKVIRSPETRIVWETLDKFPEREARLAELASFVWQGHWGFGHVITKKSERMKIAKDARKRATAFASTLERISEQDWFSINSIVASFVDVSVTRRIQGEIESFHAIYNDDPASNQYVPLETLQRAFPAIEQVAKNLVAEAMWGSLQYHVLGGLCGSLDKWAESDLVLTKPDHPNAKRLYFIRSLTRGFVENYGRPMRKETLALACVFFDCSGLDEAAISRLAPVRSANNFDEFAQPE